MLYMLVKVFLPVLYVKYKHEVHDQDANKAWGKAKCFIGASLTEPHTSKTCVIDHSQKITDKYRRTYHNTVKLMV